MAPKKKPSVNIKKGDTVKVIAGKDKGAEGKIIKVLREEQRVIVEGVNRIKKHTKVVNQGGRAGNTGGIITQEAGVHVSNVMLVEGDGLIMMGDPGDDFESAVREAETGADDERGLRAELLGGLLDDVVQGLHVGPPSARERAQRLACALPYRRIVREQDRLHVELREPRDGAARETHVVGEEIARQRHLPAYALQQITDDEQPTCRGIQTDAAGGVTGRV